MPSSSILTYGVGASAPTLLAISLRQPWAWAILYAGKDVENRVFKVASRFRRLQGQRVALHAGRSLDGFDDACAFLERLDIEPPDRGSIPLGGVVGSFEVGAVVKASPSPWFVGPWGIQILDPTPCAFAPCRGQLGLFKVG